MAEQGQGYPEPEESEAEWIEPVVPDLDTPFEVSPELQHHNLQDLLQLYYADTDAPRAIELFDSLERQTYPRDLEVVLRDHRTSKITDPQEIIDRAALDDLLTCYSVLEVATQVDYVGPLDGEFRAQATRILERKEVRPYYEFHYPLLLPQLFRARLEGIGSVGVHRGPRQVAALQRILELDTRFIRNPEVQVFLALADDFQIRGNTREHLFQVVSEPAQLAERLARPREQRDILDDALRGLRGFLFLSDGLYRTLRTLDGDSLFQSTLWHLFGYWFSERSGAVVPSVLHILDRFDAWDADPGDQAEQDFTVPARAGTEAIRTAITALASPRYARPLEQEADRILKVVSTGVAEFDPSDMIRDLVRSLEERAQRQGIELHADISPKLPAVAINPAQLSHALGLVIDNAVKCTPAKGHVTVSAHADYVNPTRAVTMMVSCRASPQNVLQKWLYSYLPGRRKRGAALGLAMVQKLIAENNGRLTFEYPEGIGMDYRIILPGRAWEEAR
jgi:signal transduction histidine kinase